MVAQIKKHLYCLCLCYCTIRKQGGCVTDNVSESLLICTLSHSLGLSFNSGDTSYVITQDITLRAIHLLTFQSSEQRAAVLRSEIRPEQILSSP